ncbi:MAG: T9SS type A sorting domain-containing protein [Bacteroidales bacterium]
MKRKVLLIVSFIAISVAINAQVPEFWYLDEVNPGMDIALYPDGTNPQQGAFACRLTLLQPEIPYLISDNFAVTAGDSYTFTIYYFDDDSRGSLKFYADFYDAQGEDIYGEDPVYSEDSDMWQSVSWTASVPAGAVEGYILVKFYDDDGYTNEAVAWVDNVSFVVNGENMVLNGSMESWPGVGFEVPVYNRETVALYPNPVSDVLNISLENTVADKIEIRNVLGQQVKTVFLSNDKQMELNVSGLQEGIYFVAIFNNDKIIDTQRVLKK